MTIYSDVQRVLGYLKSHPDRWYDMSQLLSDLNINGQHVDKVAAAIRADRNVDFAPSCNVRWRPNNGAGALGHP